MKSTNALLAIAELASSQWGLLTTAQAIEQGVTRLDLSRLARLGHVERVAHGVYRHGGAPSLEFENLRAAWLAADPGTTADRRLNQIEDGVVVMGATAAALHRLGDLPADRHEFSAPVRRQTQRRNVGYRHRRLQLQDVTMVDGLPVTTIERTIADLVEARIDLSLVAQVMSDAARTHIIDAARLSELLSPLAARHGLRKQDGTALLHRLRALAGLEAAALGPEI